MERFVIGAAIVAAVAIAAAATFGGSITTGDAFHFSIERDESGGGGGTPMTSGPMVYAATKIEIEDAVAIVTVIPEDRADVEVAMANPGVVSTPTMRLNDGALVLDGGLARKIRKCSSANGALRVTVAGLGDVDATQMPEITIRMPRNVDFSASGGVSARIGDAASVRVRSSGCGPVTIGAVTGELDAAVDGSGDITAGPSQHAALAIAGSGDVTAGAVAERLSMAIAGSGDVEVAAVGGPLDVSIAGSGSASVLGGRATSATVSIAGAGDVMIRGDVGDLEANIAGSGSVDVTGTAASVNASILGAGDVNVAAVTGVVKRSVLGAGRVRVGGQQ
jgi:hypothetical protein